MSETSGKRKASPESSSMPNTETKKLKLQDESASASTSPLASRSSLKPDAAGKTEEQQVPTSEAATTSNTKDDQKGSRAGKKGNSANRYKGRKREGDWKNSRNREDRQVKEGSADGNEDDKEKRLPKRKVAVAIGYCGTGMSGSQINPGVKTVEGEIFKAFVAAGCVSEDNSKDPTKVNLLRAARTDAGVHAAINVISVKLILQPANMAPDTTLIQYINSFLPEGIHIWSITRVQSSFNPRTFCDSRMYDYCLPTYVFLPPKPGTAMAESLAKVRSSHSKPYESTPADKYWQDNLTTQPEVVDAGPKGEDVDYTATPQFKAEMKIKNAYRITPDLMEGLKAAALQYEGTHNFHNFTIGKDFKDRSAQRTMKKLTISDPFIVAGSEWISIKVHGQSFMLHQIRKMVGMLVLVVRTQTPASLIPEIFGPSKIHVPKAPALGLLLEQPIFENYNKKVAEANVLVENQVKRGKITVEQAENDGQKKDPVTYDDEATQTAVSEFKQKHVYDKMWLAEAETNTFAKFLNLLDAYPGHDFAYLNPEGVIPKEAIMTADKEKTSRKKEDVKEEDLEDEDTVVPGQDEG